MRIYLAGGSSERILCAEYMRRLRERGHTITHDWTSSEGFTRQLNHSEQREEARRDFQAVLDADLVWVMIPAEKSEGSHFELGAAVALNIPVVTSGPHRTAQHRIFPLLVTDHYESHLDALIAVSGMRHAA